MIVVCFSYTNNGASICSEIVDYFRAQEDTNCWGYALEKYCSSPNLQSNPPTVEECFSAGNIDALIFIGAIGIAVRKIAPYIQSKVTDPAVIVIDEQSNYVIPILSGHIGGANALATQLASLLNATAVITTATDLQNKFSVDTWAVQNNLAIVNAEQIKSVSSAILDNEEVGLFSDFPFENNPPPGICLNKKSETGIVISLNPNTKPFPKGLLLCPKCIIAGIGCRKGVSLEAVEDLLLQTLQTLQISKHALCAFASIDLKKEEPALLQLSQKYKLPFFTYSAEQLSDVSGNFSASSFVKQTTGVDNVCERAAILTGAGQLICKKIAQKGVTIALSQNSFSVRWS